MFLAASAYFPPVTCQSDGLQTQSCQRQELRDLPPSKGLGEDVGQLSVGRDPFEADFLRVQEFIDHMKFTVDMLMFFSGSAIGADLNSSFVVAQQKRRREIDELR